MTDILPEAILAVCLLDLVFVAVLWCIDTIRIKAGKKPLFPLWERDKK